MKAVVQRVKEAKVTVDHKVVGEINQGLVILLGIHHDDTEKDIDTIINKLIHLRIFPDEEDKMNLSLKDIDGSVLSISQFTLYGDVRKGRRPSFTNAANPSIAEKLYNTFNDRLQKEGIHVETGSFGAMMDVHLINDGPVTFVIEAKEGKLK